MYIAAYCIYSSFNTNIHVLYCNNATLFSAASPRPDAHSLKTPFVEGAALVAGTIMGHKIRNGKRRQAKIQCHDDELFKSYMQSQIDKAKSKIELNTAKKNW